MNLSMLNVEKKLSHSHVMRIYFENVSDMTLVHHSITRFVRKIFKKIGNHMSGALWIDNQIPIFLVPYLI